MQNSREKFKQAFPDNHSLIVALHSQHLEHALEGAKIAIDNGAHGVALVTYAIPPLSGLAFADRIKEKFPYHKVLLNVLQRDPYKFRDKNRSRGPKCIMESARYTNIDGLITDIPVIKGINPIADEPEYVDYADTLLQWQQENWWDKLYFWGFDFKGKHLINAKIYPSAVEQAKKYLDVITTSWLVTSVAPDIEKIIRIKSLAGDHPVGLASGVTSENIHEYLPYTDISIVATGISKDYYNLDPNKVAQLAKIIEQYNRKMDRKQFEAAVLQKYDMSSATELHTYLSQWAIINIGMSTEHGETQKKLSNLYPSPFVLDGVEYASVEAFRMSIKYPPTDPRRVEIRQLSGMKAKNAWRDAKWFKSLWYENKEIRIWSPEHHALLKRALKAKLEQNPDILETLLNTWDKPLIHIVFTRREGEKHVLHDSKTIPGDVFAQLYTELRDEFRKR